MDYKINKTIQFKVILNLHVNIDIFKNFFYSNDSVRIRSYIVKEASYNRPSREILPLNSI